MLNDSRRARKLTPFGLARQLFDLATYAQAKGWSAEELLCTETQKQEKRFRKRESGAAQ